MSLLRAVFRFFLFCLLCVFVILVQTIVLLVHQGRYARIIPHFFMNAVRVIFGIRLQVRGTPYIDSQTLYVSNHLSYLDIPVIGSVLKTLFVSRGDVTEWPLIGYLTKLGQTAYVARSRSAAAGDANAVNSVIYAGKSLIVFPEGTSTDGQSVLDFKSSLFSLVVGDDKPNMMIQPMTLEVLQVDGRPLETQKDRDVYAWHRDMDMELFSHLWLFAQNRGVEICLTFHPPIPAKDYNDRKILAKACHKAVSNGLGNNSTDEIAA